MSFSWDAIQIVFTDGNSFGGIRQRHQHFAAGVAQHNGVLYIEEPGNWLTVGVSPEKPFSNWTAWKAGPQEVEHNVWVWTPPPGRPVPYWSAAINTANHAKFASALERVAGPIPVGRLIQVACNPLAVGWIPHLDPRRAIYDCCDEFSSFPMPSKKPEVVLAIERELMQQCDVTVFSSGTTLRAKLSDRAKPSGRGNGPTMRSPQGSPRKVVHIRNGCHAAHFGQADPATSPMPPDLAPIAAQGPVLLYFGAIAAWFDEERIHGLCKARPDWQVVLLGPVSRPLPRLKGLANCHLLGRKPYAELPHYVAHAGVGLLPNIRTPQQDAADHVKVYEYLAGGLGIMGNPLTELSFFRSFVTTGETTAEWIVGIEAFLAEGPEAREPRQRFAGLNTWENRIEWFRRVLLQPEKRLVDAAKATQWAEEERLLETLRSENQIVLPSDGETPPMMPAVDGTVLLPLLPDQEPADKSGGVADTSV